MEGWTYGSKRNNAARKHPLLIPYAELPEEQKGKDRRTILNYPKYAKTAGFRIVASVGSGQMFRARRSERESGQKIRQSAGLRSVTCVTIFRPQSGRLRVYW